MRSREQGLPTEPRHLWRSRPPAAREGGFSLLELLVVIAILGIVAAFALPNAINFVKAYRLHTRASAIASQLNVARFRATSQYTPYRVNFRLSESLYSMDRLDASYASPTTEVMLGLSTGITFLSSCPVTARPGTIPGTYSAVSTSIHFNTRGLPVDSSGNPSNENVIYLQNDSGLYDAVTVSLGGRVTVWGYASGTGTWVTR